MKKRLLKPYRSHLLQIGPFFVQPSHKNFISKLFMLMRQTTPVLVWMVGILLFIASPGFSQNITVKGRITDGAVPLSGVNILVKGTTNGTTTDVEGRFSISAPSNGVLVVSHAGYTTKEIPINGRTEITDRLELAADDLEDVIVVGYGVQRKLTSTGAIASVKGEELVKAPVAGLSNALIGQVAGLQAVQNTGEFGSDQATIYVRGMATLNGSGRNPLIIVDGVVRETFNNIDPNEVESINVLKDASATAVYGVRGANGVIIITTRQGKAGKPVMNLSSNVAFLQPVILPDLLPAYEYALLRNEAERNMGKTPTFSEEDLRLYQTGEDPIFHSNINWVDELIKDFSTQQSYNFNVSGGTEKLRYFTSLGYFNQSGGYHKPETSLGFPYRHSYNRFNIRMNFDFNFSKDFTMSVRLGEQITDNSFPNGGAWGAFDKANNLSPISGPAYVDGKYIESIRGMPAGVPFFNPFGMAGPTSTNGAFVTDQFSNTINTNISLKYRLDRITPGLSIRAMGAYDSYYRKQAIRNKYHDAYTILKDPNDPGNVIIYKSKEAGPFYGMSNAISDNNKWRKMYAEAGIEYDRTFGDHKVTGLILANAEKGYFPNLEYKLPAAYLGLVSRVTYAYKSKYLTELNMGYNGSENFREGARFGFFPSFSLGYIVSEEKFFPKISAITFLKLRGSYGKVGNDKLAARRYLYIDGPFTVGNGGYQATVMGTAGLDMLRYNMYNEGRLGFADVQWEIAEKFNIGAEMRFLNDRLTLSGDYFQEVRNNILWNLSTIPELVGMPGTDMPPANIGKVQNRGYEIELGYNDRIDNFTYWVKGAWSFARNRINFMDEPNRAYEWMRRTGRPLNQYYGLTFEGFYNTWDEINDSKRPISQWEGAGLQPGDMKYKDLNGDGFINSQDMGPIGYSNWPEITYSASFGFSYKGFDMTVLTQGTGHVSVYFASSAAYPFTADWGPAHRWNLERWTPERYAAGEPISFPRLELSPGAQHNYQVSDFWVQNGSYFRIKNVEMGYRFSNSLLANLGLKSCRVYVSGNNLYTWTRMKYRLDPDARESWGRVMPPMRVFNAGVNLQF